MTTTSTNTKSSDPNVRFALYKLEDGKKLYLAYAPTFIFAKRGRNPYTWTFKKNAEKYQTECWHKGIITYIEEVPAYVPKNPYGPRGTKKASPVLDVIVTPTPFEMIKEGNRYNVSNAPLRDAKGRFIKAA